MKKDISKWVGHRIKVRRIDLEITQIDLAQRLGVTQAYLSYLEKGQRQITLGLLEKIASALQCPMSELMPPEKNSQEAA